MTGNNIDFKKRCKIEFGAYVEAYEKKFPLNSTQSHTEPVICLGPTGNLQCSYWFLNIRTGFHIKQHTFSLLPVSTRVIDRVQALANTNKQKPALDLFVLLGDPIPYDDTPEDKNEYNAKDLAWMENCENQPEIPGVTTPDHQEEILGVTKPEEKENIIEMEIPE